jgi:homoserine O-acetyltransferase/O-succinyltransferase
MTLTATRLTRYFVLSLCLSTVCPRLAVAYDGLVEKKVLTLPSFATVGGEVLKNMRFGYEMYGRLNAAKDNAILVLPYFSGTGHAAGKFAKSDPAPGYWDSIIGPGKPLDTDRYCIIAGDGLINQATKDGHTITTGPASIDPSTGKPYGMRFPILTMRDLVNAQKALIDSLGIHKLHAVTGLSMGGIQSFEWAAVFPDSTDRVIPVVGLAEADGYLIGNLDTWSAPITLDPKWSHGDYYGKDEPIDGLTASFKIVFHEAQNYGSIDKAVDRKWAQQGKDPAKSWDNKFLADRALDDGAKAYAAVRDANSFLYQVKAVQLFVAGDEPTLDAGLAKVKARLLILPARSDLMLYPKYSQAAAEHLRRLGKWVEYHEIPGDGGHLDSINNIASVGDLISRFLRQ